MVETFTLRLALGLLGSLYLIRRQGIEARFFQIHHLIALGLMAAAGAFAWNTDQVWFFLPWGLALCLTMAGTWAWSIEELAKARWPMWFLAVLSLLAALMMCAAVQASPRPWWMALVLESTSAAALGLAITAMLLGHWYLNSPTMSIDPLVQLLRAFFFALAARGLVFIWLWGDATHFAYNTDRLGWLWLSLRIGAGLLGAAVLSYMAWETAKIRSTQSATGILYVLDIFVILGEIVDLMLMEHLLMGRGS